MMFVSRRRHRARMHTKDEFIGRQAQKLDDTLKTAAGVERIAGELDRMKETVALHIVAAGHPSTVPQTATEFAEALQEALAAAQVDIRLELARLEGAEL